MRTARTGTYRGAHGGGGRAGKDHGARAEGGDGVAKVVADVDVAVCCRVRKFLRACKY